MTFPMSDAIAKSGMLTKDRGRLGRPVAINRLLIPRRLKLEENRIVWTLELQRRDFGLRWVTPPGDLLDRFVRLADADDVKMFARGFGPLELCEHGLPFNHPPADGAPPCQRQPVGFDVETWWEPVEAWLVIVRRFRATLEIAARLHLGHAIPRPLWHNYFRGFPGEDSPPPGQRPLSELRRAHPDYDREEIAGRVVNFLELGRAVPRLVWKSRHASPRVTFHADGLFGVLAVQLMLAVARTEGWAICSHCGAVYSPARQPDPSRRNFCDECRRAGVPLKLAKRDSRARQRRNGGRHE
jgi:hypothetical protein